MKLRITLLLLFAMSGAVIFQAATEEILFRKTFYAGDAQVVRPQAVVGMVKSAKENAMDITKEDIEEMVREAVARAGGMDDLIFDGATVVLKPNIVSIFAETVPNFFYVPPEANGQVTDWRVIAAVSKMVRELNPSGKILLMEGVANYNTYDSFEYLHHTKEYLPEVDEFIALEKESGTWNDYNSDKLVAATLPPEVALYPDDKKPNKSPEFYLNKRYYEADVIISLPMLKNHSMTMMTGAVKNVGIGSTPASIYSASPTEFNRYLGNRIDHQNYTNLHKWIHDFYLLKPVTFAIMDGIQGVDHGPDAEGVQESRYFTDCCKNRRLMLASRDPLAMDAIASCLMNIDPRRVKHLAYLHADSVGCADPAFIRVNGPYVDEQVTTYLGATRSRDLEPPAAEILSVEAQENNLHVQLSVDESELAKVEVFVDGKLLDYLIVRNFSDFTIPAENVSPTSQIQLDVYDLMLNRTTLYYPSTKVGSNQLTPLQFGILSSYPNPFNPSTRIRFCLDETAPVKLQVFDLLGRLTATLVDDILSAGEYEKIYTAHNSASGLYFCRLVQKDRIDTTSLILLE